MEMIVNVIRSESRWFPDLRELWRMRHIVWSFVRRNLMVRYAQTILGPIWLLFQASVAAVVFSLFFGSLLNVPSDGLPYPIFVVSGTLLWNLFQRGAIEISTSIAGQANLINKVYFPRLSVPVSALITVTIEQIPLVLILAGLCAFYGVSPAWTVVFVPIVIVFVLFVALGVGLCTTSVDTIYRDARLVLPHTLQIMFYLTPVVFPISLLSERWQYVLLINPLAGLIEGFRALAFGIGPPMNYLPIGVGSALSIAVLLLGLVVFVRAEPLFVDRA
jgi:lipopolysaccharide transport system permease protein